MMKGPFTDVVNLRSERKTALRSVKIYQLSQYSNWPMYVKLLMHDNITLAIETIFTF